MPRPPVFPHVHGPFDGDFDPFEDEDDGGPLITFGRAGGTIDSATIRRPDVTVRRRPS